MDAADLTGAAALLESAGAGALPAAHARERAVAILSFLGLSGPDGAIHLTQAGRRGFVRLLRTASRMDAVFPMRLPTAPGAAFFGARKTHGGGVGSVFAGDGAPKRADYAGLGAGLREAFCACIGEAAEHEAMLLRRQDDRLAANGVIQCLDWQMRAAGGIAAALILREAGQGRPPPRSSTGYAAGPTLEDAALSALLECTERHAVSLWFNGLNKPVPLLAAEAMTSYSVGLRGPGAPLVRLMLLPHDIEGAIVAAASSVSAAGCIAVGYGCAPSAEQAAMKAVRELCQGEFALHLESQSTTPGHGAFTAKSEMFLNRSELFETGNARREAEEGAQGLSSLCTRFPHQVRFVDLTLPSDGVPVVCALADGIRDIASEFGPGQTGPL
jgi:ribosomal protein S12 methylthiotransferase accessory factor YcaO